MHEFKTGIFHWYGYILPLEGRLRQIKQAGFDYVMLWWEDEVYPHTISRMELINILKSYDLKLDNVHLPFENINNLWNESSAQRNNHIDLVKKWLNECKLSGADTVVMHASQGSSNELNLSFGYDSFSEIAREAENIHIKVAVENTQMLKYTDFILKEITSPNIGFCYDSSHDFVVNGNNSGEILDRWKSKLIAVHLSDNDGLYDRHWIPGNGIINWNKIINIVEHANIKSYSMEVVPSDEEKKLIPIEFLIKARKNMEDKIIKFS
jgi:sugar phosphate isomerase/epimerase